MSKIFPLLYFDITSLFQSAANADEGISNVKYPYTRSYNAASKDSNNFRNHNIMGIFQLW